MGRPHREPQGRSRIGVFVGPLLAIAAVALATWSFFTGTAEPATPHVTPAQRDAMAWQRKERHRLERAVAWQKAHAFDVAYPTLRQAAFIAARIYRVSPWEILSVAYCESRATGEVRSSAATNRRSRAKGPLQYLRSTWRHTRFAAFDVTNAFVAVLATAQIVEHEGWSQWSCKPQT